MRTLITLAVLFHYSVVLFLPGFRLLDRILYGDKLITSAAHADFFGVLQ